MPRGRPKKSSTEPSNISFWKGMLKDKKVQIFLDKGNTQQKDNIKSVLYYLKRMENDFFDEVSGQLLLDKLGG